jgi:hypothetical protein
MACLCACSLFLVGSILCLLPQSPPSDLVDASQTLKRAPPDLIVGEHPRETEEAVPRAEDGGVPVSACRSSPSPATADDSVLH